MTSPLFAKRTTSQRVVEHLRRIYPHLQVHELDQLRSRLQAAMGPASNAASEASRLPGSDEVVLITYGDTFRSANSPHLRSLTTMWHEHFAELFSTVHVLPFFPSSGDGGFSVVDYTAVAAAMGTWQDLANMVGSSGLMVDVICNHGSVQSEWFADFVADRSPGRDYFVTADPDDDLEMVTRPRTHPLLLPVETAAGVKHVWATFSHDQVDFDFSNPEVLVEFCKILGLYVSHGATHIRLDAIAYLWKQIGTTCVHLPQTHDVVKLMRTLLEARNPNALLITETNVPHEQNVSYFGDGDEAHVVYNFTLAPLIVSSLITGRAETLTRWLLELEPPPPGCTFLNFIASHDGIGLRPVEDLVPSADLKPLIDRAVSVGGDYSAYSTPSGPRAYELNVSLADLLAGIDGQTSDRFVVAHALMLAMQGIPAIYVHSMLVSPGDVETAARTGHKRDINREQVDLNAARDRISSGWRANVFAELAHLIKVRRSHDAFAPSSPQTAHELHPQVTAVQRGTGPTGVLALHNMSDQPVSLELPLGSATYDLLSEEIVSTNLTLAPYQARWLSHH